MAGETSSALLAATVAPSPLFNFSAAQFTAAKAGVTRVKASGGRSKWLFPGDSTTWGENGGNTYGLRDGAHNNTVAAVISASFTASSIPSAQDNLFASGANTVGGTVIADFRNSYKPGLNIASPWVIDAGVTTMGGRTFSVTSADATGFVYTPEVQVDSFEIGDLQASGAGVYTWQVDGGGATTVTETNAVAARTIQSISAGAKGTHTLTIKRVSGTPFIRYVKGWDSTTSQVDILQMGRGQSVTGDWVVNTSPYNSLGSFTAEASTADFVGCNLGINEVAAGTVQATFKANYQLIINAGIAGGATFLLIVPHQTDTSVDDVTAQANIRQWIKDLATTNNLPCLDLQTRFGPYAAMAGQGYMFNARHCNKAGYAAEGAYIASVLKTWTT